MGNLTGLTDAKGNNTIFQYDIYNRVRVVYPGGRTVLDLGCGVGDQAAEIVARGACVIGIDMNEQLLHEAQSRQLPNAEFRIGDLRTSPDLGVAVDGLWCSFTAAYLPDLPAPLASWASHLEPGGWIALTGVDDLFGHEPLSASTKALFEGYARDALMAGRYDFCMGRKLRNHLEQSGFTVSKLLTLQDQELSFGGTVPPLNRNVRYGPGEEQTASRADGNRDRV